MVLPNDFISSMNHLLGEEGSAQLQKAIADDPTVSVRKNPLKWIFDDAHIKHRQGSVAWCEDGIYLEERPTFTFDPLMHAGCYYVQEASSMFLALIMRQYADKPVNMLDLCAAPGGKSTLARAMLNDKSILISNEPIRNRVQILAENITKFGHPRTIVTNNYPKEFQHCDINFDIILTDVPCSGEGMFRKDATAIDEWSLSNVDSCQRRQREIVSDIWCKLKPGGILIYSTCTFNTKENEENVKWIMEQLGASALPIEVQSNWNITGSLLEGFEQPVYHFLPGRTNGEGLFMAVMRKNGNNENMESFHAPVKKTRKKENKKTCITVNRQWLKDEKNFEFIINDDFIRAIPQDVLDVYRDAATHLKIISAGVAVGTVKGKDILPDQSLALSTALNRESFPTVDVNYQQAISYLHKETVTLPPDTPRGFVLLTFKDVPLGFEKNIGNRANNLYPQEWRIRSGHTPQDNQCVIE